MLIERLEPLHVYLPLFELLLHLYRTLRKIAGKIGYNKEGEYIRGNRRQEVVPCVDNTGGYDLVPLRKYPVEIEVHEEAVTDARYRCRIEAPPSAEDNTPADNGEKVEGGEEALHPAGYIDDGRNEEDIKEDLPVSKGCQPLEPVEQAGIEDSEDAYPDDDDV